MKIFLCPDKFKGSASSSEVIDAIARGITSVLPEAEIRSSAISDGGDGFAQIASRHLEGTWVEMDSIDALHRPIKTSYFLSDGIAYIDMALTNGLVQIAPANINPMLSSTLGTGKIIRHAAEVSKVKQIIIGLGGSATNDGGAGMASALGVRFLDASGNELLPFPAELIHCSSIDQSERIPLPSIIAACDVSNPLLGENGATAIYGPQKGVSAIEDFEAILAQLMVIDNGQADAQVPGSGAAGGIAYGLLHYASASLESGFSIVADIIHLEEEIDAADIIITGEGSLDAQTLNAVSYTHLTLPTTSRV